MKEVFILNLNPDDIFVIQSNYNHKPSITRYLMGTGPCLLAETQQFLKNKGWDSSINNWTVGLMNHVILTPICRQEKLSHGEPKFLFESVFGFIDKSGSTFARIALGSNNDYIAELYKNFKGDYKVELITEGIKPYYRSLPEQKDSKPETEEMITVPLWLFQGLADAAAEDMYPVAGDAFELIRKHKDIKDQL